jgi:phage terminase large subunit-like protein
MNSQTMNLIQPLPISKLELHLLARLERAKDRRLSRTKLQRYSPYPKQAEFHAAGAQYRERLLIAANQVGKTLAGAAESAIHLTGQYPVGWTGKRFHRPITMLAGSESYELTRDGVQRLLMGPPASEEDWGTGYIPHAAIVDYTRRSGIANAIETVTVRHESGGASSLLFKAYEQGRGKWQANTVDYVWFDEEPPEDVYFEGLTRTNATGGIVAMTFTPLMGMSSVVARYLMEQNRDRHVTTMTIDDAEHFSPEERERIIASYPAHELEARTKGVPSMGSGRIFPIEESKIVIDPLPFPDHWAQIGGMDFGYDHPFAAVRCAWDRDTDVFYIGAEYRERQATPIIHSAAIRPWGDNLWWAWPHDGLQHDKGSGVELARQYAMQKLRMLPDHATFEDGMKYGVEAGVLDMLQRMTSGRLKVFSTCRMWLEEFRLYHRKDGKIVKERDDLMSASRYALMMKRFAEPPTSPVSFTLPYMPGGPQSWMA